MNNNPNDEYVITVEQYIADNVRGTAGVLEAGVLRLQRTDLSLHTKMETLELMGKIAAAGADRLHVFLAKQIEVTHHNDISELE